MRRDTAVFTLAMVIQLAGLVTLLYGEESGLDVAIYGGGFVVLLGFGIMTGTIAMIEGPDEHAA